MNILKMIKRQLVCPNCNGRLSFFKVKGWKSNISIECPHCKTKLIYVKKISEWWKVFFILMVNFPGFLLFRRSDFVFLLVIMLISTLIALSIYFLYIYYSIHLIKDDKNEKN